jgi:hypothetical protein
MNPVETIELKKLPELTIVFGPERQAVAELRFASDQPLSRERLELGNMTIWSCRWPWLAGGPSGVRTGSRGGLVACHINMWANRNESRHRGESTMTAAEPASSNGYADKIFQLKQLVQQLGANEVKKLADVLSQAVDSVSPVSDRAFPSSLSLCCRQRIQKRTAIYDKAVNSRPPARASAVNRFVASSSLHRGA